MLEVLVSKIVSKIFIYLYIKYIMFNVFSYNSILLIKNILSKIDFVRLFKTIHLFNENTQLYDMTMRNTVYIGLATIVFSMVIYAVGLINEYKNNSIREMIFKKIKIGKNVFCMIGCLFTTWILDGFCVNKLTTFYCITELILEMFMIFSFGLTVYSCIQLFYISKSHENFLLSMLKYSKTLIEKNYRKINKYKNNRISKFYYKKKREKFTNYVKGNKFFACFDPINTGFDESEGVYSNDIRKKVYVIKNYNYKKLDKIANLLSNIKGPYIKIYLFPPGERMNKGFPLFFYNNIETKNLKLVKNAIKFDNINKCYIENSNLISDLFEAFKSNDIDYILLKDVYDYILFNEYDLINEFLNHLMELCDDNNENVIYLLAAINSVNYLYNNPEYYKTVNNMIISVLGKKIEKVQNNNVIKKSVKEKKQFSNQTIITKFINLCYISKYKEEYREIYEISLYSCVDFIYYLIKNNDTDGIKFLLHKINFSDANIYEKQDLTFENKIQVKMLCYLINLLQNSKTNINLDDLFNINYIYFESFTDYLSIFISNQDNFDSEDIISEDEYNFMYNRKPYKDEIKYNHEDSFLKTIKTSFIVLYSYIDSYQISFDNLNLELAKRINEIKLSKFDLLDNKNYIVFNDAFDKQLEEYINNYKN